MPPTPARLHNHELLGEPELDILLSDPVMLSLWRADHIDPDDARRLFARTAAMLCRRTRPGRSERQSERSDERVATTTAYAMI